MPSTPVTRAPLAPPAAVGGDAFGPTSSVAVSEHGHGHHVVTQYLQGAQLLGESQCQLAGEAAHEAAGVSRVRSASGLRLLRPPGDLGGAWEIRYTGLPVLLVLS